MKILFVSATLPPDHSATATLVGNIARCLREHADQIDGITVKEHILEPAVKHEPCMTVHRVNALLSNSARNKSIADMAWILQQRFARKLRRAHPGLYDEGLVRTLLRKMRQIKACSYDVIVAVCAYYDAAEAVRRYCLEQAKHPKIVLYQVDPLTENAVYEHLDKAVLREYESTLYRLCDRVLTTPLIFEAKKGMWDLQKVIPVEFPALVRPQISKAIQRDGKEIRCVFAGYLYGTIRDASATLELFALMQEERFHLYIIGEGQKELLEEYAAGRLKGRLHLLGELPVDACNAWLASADVLVNIGNKVCNQLPSKLITYLSYGKTILNVAACKECPTLRYMDTYPLAVSLLGEQVQQRSMVMKTEERLLKHSSRTIPFESVVDLFPDCTPQSVVEKLLAPLNDSE